MSDEITPPNSENPDVPAAPANDQSYPSVPSYTTSTSAPVKKSKSKSKKWMLIAIAIFSVIVLSGIGVFAFNAFSDPTVGADSPEGVITNFANAANDKDLPTMLTSVDPSEVEPLIENISTFTKAAKKDGAIKNDKKPLEAYSYKFENLKTKTVMYSDDVARVEIVSGKFIVKVDKSKLPEEERDNANNEVTDFAEANKSLVDNGESLFDNFDEDELETKNNFYIAVKRDGKWYASALYTAAEYSRIFANSYGQDIPRPSFDVADRKGIGADSGEKAVKNFLEALVSLRTKDIIEATAPDRFSIAYDYKQTLLNLQNINSDNQYVKLAKDAITITDIKTKTKPNGNNREFNEIKSVSLKIKYNIDVPKKQENLYTSFPYAADLDASWDGKCLSYSGEIKAYQVTDTQDSEYDFEGEAPYTDSTGAVLENANDLYDAVYPITSSIGRVYPTDESTYFGTFHPLPWTDAKGGVVYDALGKASEAVNEKNEIDYGINYPWKDAAGVEVYDADEDVAYPDPVFEKARTNVDEKTCFSNKELKDLPAIGFVTIKENNKHYVSPIDTAWFYIIELVKKEYS